MISTFLQSRLIAGLLAAAALVLASTDAKALDFSYEGSFQTYGSGTSDSGSTAWGWCMDREYNSTTMNYDLYQETCTAGGTSGWAVTTNQNFQVEASGLIENLSSTGTNNGCIDVVGT